MYLGNDVPMPTEPPYPTLLLYVTDEPEDTILLHPEASTLRAVNPDPSPVNAVATIDPVTVSYTHLTLPTKA